MKTFITTVIALMAFQLDNLYADYTPWDTLTSDSWIETASVPAQIYSYNGSVYNLSFGTAKNNGSARNMNAVTFSDGVSNTGHLQSSLSDGSFYIDNTGGQDFTNLLLMVAINADTLPVDFSLSLTSRLQTYDLDASTDDFAYYDHPEYDTGRPSGYYSATNPENDSIAYDFETGFVSVIDLTGVSSVDPVLPGTTLEIDYLFNNLPGRAVFSAYAAQFDSSLITHTNRALIDLNDPTADISTFEVVPEPSMLTLIACGIGILVKRKSHCLRSNNN